MSPDEVANGRHEFISSLVESSDLDDSRIMSLVGHHSPASMQIYTHARNIRFLPQFEALEDGRRKERAKELAKALGVPHADRTPISHICGTRRRKTGLTTPAMSSCTRRNRCRRLQRSRNAWDHRRAIACGPFWKSRLARRSEKPRRMRSVGATRSHEGEDRLAVRRPDFPSVFFALPAPILLVGDPADLAGEKHAGIAHTRVHECAGH